ncbi:MAG TPA: hypothetical protein VM778_14540 [Gemmatimonadota bacterium]|nr:hypothetical protein [Gemmatimonadota bacterium]
MIDPVFLYHLLVFALWLAAGIYGLYLATRFVRAVEQISDALGSGSDQSRNGQG